MPNKASHGETFSPSPETEAKLGQLLARYPVREAALIPALHLVQEQVGWLPLEALDWVAGYLKVPRTQVYSVTSFYTMFRRQPPGRHRLEICTNLSCSLLGAEHLRDYLGRKLGIEPGQTTADGRITLTEVECLGSCGTAPVMLVDDEYHEQLTREKVDEILARLELADKEQGRE